MKPTYEELVVMYFDAKARLIEEFSGEIAYDVVTLWHRCNGWLDVPMTPKAHSMIEMYLEWEKEEQ